MSSDPQPLHEELQPLDPLAADQSMQPEPPPAYLAPQAGENPVWSGWDVLVITILTLGVIFLAQVLIVVVAHRLVYPHESWIDVAQKPALALLSEFLAYIPVLLYMYLLIEGKYRTRF